MYMDWTAWLSISSPKLCQKKQESGAQEKVFVEGAEDKEVLPLVELKEETLLLMVRQGQKVIHVAVSTELKK